LKIDDKSDVSTTEKYTFILSLLLTGDKENIEKAVLCVMINGGFE
jgi:hypothetical protein